MIRKTLPRWWLITVITLSGAFPLWQYGVFSDIYNADVTGIHLVIYSVFLLATVLTGFAAWRTNLSGTRGQTGHFNKTTQKIVDVCWFCSETMMTLGLIGTIAGMIYLFSMIFGDIDPSSPESLKEALGHMARGLSTAMYTTICGMIGALIIKVQLMNIEFDKVD